MDLSEYTSNRKSVETEFGEFAYLDVGEGPVALFVHGLFVSAYLWRDVAERLRGERRCIAYNLPGHGHTRTTADPAVSLEGHAEMLEAFSDALGLEDIDLVANDTGGAIAQAFAVRNPDRLRSLTLTNCEARDVLPSPHEIAQLIGTLAEKGEFAPVAVQLLEDHEIARGEAGLGVSLEHADRLTGDDIRGYLEPHYGTVESAREVERFFLALHVDQLKAVEPALRELEVPTLAVWGTGDPIFELELAYWLRDAIPGCRDVVEVEGGKLFWPGERADELAGPLRELWASAPARA